jgi:5-formyltetrahydrofolate cyclo-ligase
METKEQIRKLVHARRGQAASTDLTRDSEIIFRKIQRMDEYIMAGSIYAYMDFQNEVMTRAFIARALGDGKRVAIPKVKDGTMEFRYIDSLRQVEAGTLGIMEPTEETDRADSETALMIVPGVAFDPMCHRIGYGGGYYDRYLTDHPNHITVAVAFDFQIFDEVPHEKYDVSPLYLFTESRRFRKKKPIGVFK